MDNACRGYTLLEATVGLLLTALLLSLSVPLLRGARDQWVAVAGRDHTLAALHRTRMHARLLGGAQLRIRASPGRLETLAGDTLLWWSDELRDSGVRIELPGGRSETTITFDALGLGVVASRTLRFQRGRAESALVISSRGRARPR